MPNQTFGKACCVTVTILRFARVGSSAQAVIAEVVADGTVELDNGQVLLASALVPAEAGEAWRPVAGYADRYLVSSYGNATKAG